MQERYRDKGLQFIGIAIDDPEMVQDFHDVYGINFPTLIGGMEAVKLANTLGNRFDSLPFTAVFDRKGKTRYIQAGEITDEILEDKILPLL
jgi:peroxiredoxin